MPVPTNQPAFERIGMANVAAFLEFLGKIGASCTVRIYPTMQNNVVSHNYVCITECAPVVLEQVMMHYETFAVSVMTYTTPHSGTHSGVFVDTSYPKEKAPDQD